MPDSVRRRLPPVAFVLLVVLATYSTLGALALVQDRGDDFRRFYASAVAWGQGSNPYAVVIDDTPNLNHPLLLPLFWLFTFGSQQAGFVSWSIVSLALFALCVPTISRSARLAPADFVALTLALSATFVALAFGQVTFLLMALFTLGWHSIAPANQCGRARCSDCCPC